MKNLKSGINNITADDLTNKDNLVYIDNHPYNVLLDTGSEENYISYPLVELFKLKYYKHEKPKVRYTCLNEKFLVSYYVKLDFEYNSVKYCKEFNIFPKRKDIFLLLGRKFSEEILKKPNVDLNIKEKSIEEIVVLPHLIGSFLFLTDGSSLDISVLFFNWLLFIF